jgi:4'-phosphopantetheinyl transferase EntD
MNEEWDDLGARLFGPGALCDAVPALGDPNLLHDEERRSITHWATQRQREYAAGRLCARRLLARLGAGDVPLPRRADGSPEFPEGMVGSITHSHGLCVVAVARSGSFAALGVDVERDRALESDLWELFCGDGELNWLQRQEACRRGRLAMVLFSAKESAFKCLSGLGYGGMEPRQIEVRLEGLDPASCTRWRGLDLHASTTLTGRMLIRGEWIITGASLAGGNSKRVSEGFWPRHDTGARRVGSMGGRRGLD